MFIRIRIATLGLLYFLLAGCAGDFGIFQNYKIDIEPKPKRDYYIVKKGDTLIKISFSRHLDYRRLAAWNNIDNPDLIYPGQRLRLTPPPASAKKSKPKKVNAKNKTPRVPVPKKPVGKLDKYKWSWPTEGPITRTYSIKSGGHKGIDIAGREGQAVLAVSSGKVVYSGDGLSGYGNLIIVEHDSQFLSAYAHNRKLRVAEGGKVVRGQKIAELGKSDTRNPKLYFEIRRNGKPVDPLKYLPKK